MSKQSKQLLRVGETINKYKIERLVGSGGYGQVYSANEIGTSNHFAIKTEISSESRSFLQHEIDVLKEIKTPYFFPSVYSSGTQNGINFMVIDLLGCSVEKVRVKCDDKKFNKYTSFRVAYEMVKCIQELHKKGFIHRDIKLSNFLIRPNQKRPLCLVDFGLAKRYINKETHQHVPLDKEKCFYGTRKYASINAHECLTQSRRDDMISWFYSVVEMFVDELPWAHLRDDDIYTAKKETKPADICSGLPVEFVEIYRRLRVLRYEDEPPYRYILQILESKIKEFNSSANKFEWESFSNEKIASISAVDINNLSDADLSSSSYSSSYSEDGESGSSLFSYLCRI